MVKLAGIISRLEPVKVMVIGDLMMDTYTIGKARRISPEAPVAVVQVQREEHRPGGAGNTILNLVSLGAQAVIVGRVGYDSSGEFIKKTLSEEKVDTRGIVYQNGFFTPVKNRIIAENQQIVRVDHEQTVGIPEMLEQQVIETLPGLLEGVKVVAISDYGKGFLSRTLLAAVIEQAKLRGIPVIADPKGVDFTRYSGATIIKPNLMEAYAAANLPVEASLEQVAAKVLQSAQAEVLLVTRSESGISIFHRDGSRQDFPVKARQVKDVTGAGDTVLAVLACALANQLPIEVAAQLSNVAAGIAIEHFGCARVSLSDLAHRLLEHDVVNKVFDEEHLFALKEALRGRKYALLGLSSKQGMTSFVFKAIRQMAQADRDLIVYLYDSQPEEDFVNILASLHEIKFILINHQSLQHLCQAIKPEAIYGVLDSQFIPFDSSLELRTLAISRNEQSGA